MHLRCGPYLVSPTGTLSPVSRSRSESRSTALGSPEWSRRCDRCSDAQARVDRTGSRRGSEARRERGRRGGSSPPPAGAPLILSPCRRGNLKRVSMPWRRTQRHQGHGLPCVPQRRLARRRRPPLWQQVSALPERRRLLLHLVVALLHQHRARMQRKLELDRSQRAPWGRHGRRPRRWPGRARRSRLPMRQRCGDRQRSRSAGREPRSERTTDARDGVPGRRPGSRPVRGSGHPRRAVLRASLRKVATTWRSGTIDARAGRNGRTPLGELVSWEDYEDTERVAAWDRRRPAAIT